MTEKSKIAKKAVHQHWCVYCMAEGMYVTATHYLYNYADEHTLPLCEECFRIEKGAPHFFDLNVN